MTTVSHRVEPETPVGSPVHRRITSPGVFRPASLIRALPLAVRHLTVLGTKTAKPFRSKASR